MEIVTARSRRARLLGLALRRCAPPGRALLLPRCRSVHTFGMRFPLDLIWLDRQGNVLALDEGVAPRRVCGCLGAAAVIEAPAGRGHAALLAWQNRGMAEDTNRFVEALDPRRPLYRDTYNEYLVFFLSAVGSVAGTQIPLYIVMALTHLWPVEIFVPACVVFELAVIFGIARPRMKPIERVGWAVLWGASTAVLATAFYYLVAEPTL